jgi:hypothetical protein
LEAGWEIPEKEYSRHTLDHPGPTASEDMSPLLKEIRHNPMLWLLVFVPVVFAAAKFRPEAHTLLFVSGRWWPPF